MPGAGQGDYDPPTAVRKLPSWLLGQAARRAHDLVTEALADDPVTGAPAGAGVGGHEGLGREELGRQGLGRQGLGRQGLGRQGLGRQHYTVLASLAEHGQASQAELGRRLWLDRSDMHAIVSSLERRGLIERSPDPADQRRKVVTITTDGERTLDLLQQRIESAQTQILEPLDKREREQLIALLTRIGRAHG